MPNKSIYAPQPFLKGSTHETDRVSGLVVARDGNVNKLQRSVSVTKGNDGDVDVGGLPDGLVVDTGVSDDDETGLLEGSGDVVGEGSGGAV